MKNEKGFTESCLELNKIFNKYLTMQLNTHSTVLEKSILKLKFSLEDLDILQSVTTGDRGIMAELVHHVHMLESEFNNINSLSKREDIVSEYLSSYKDFIKNNLYALAKEFTNLYKSYDYYSKADELVSSYISSAEPKVELVIEEKLIEVYKYFKSIVFKTYNYFRENKSLTNRDIFLSTNNNYVSLLNNIDVYIKKVKINLENSSLQNSIKLDSGTDKYLGASGNVILVKKPDEFQGAIGPLIAHCLRKNTVVKYY